MEMTVSDYSHLRDYIEEWTLSCPLATQPIRKGLTRWVKEVGVEGRWPVRLVGTVKPDNPCLIKKGLLTQVFPSWIWGSSPR